MSSVAGRLARELTRYPRYWTRILRRPSTVRVHGVLLELDGRVTPKIRRSIYAERYERREARCLLARLEPRDVVLEVGSGMGFISTLCARLVGSERVFSYEANPRMIALIRRTYALNGVAPTLVQASLAEREGVVTLYPEEEFASSSTIRRSASACTLSVPQLEANREIARIRPTVLIMDVEGAEADLVPILDWSGIRKVVIDLHPQVIGAQRTEQTLTCLRSVGFRVDRALSSSRKKYLQR